MTETPKRDHPNFPASQLIKLYDNTGTREGASKGFLFFYVDHDGKLGTIAKCDNMATSLAIQKGMEIFMENQLLEEDIDLDFDI